MSSVFSPEAQFPVQQRRCSRHDHQSITVGAVPVPVLAVGGGGRHCGFRVLLCSGTGVFRVRSMLVDVLLHTSLQWLSQWWTSVTLKQNSNKSGNKSVNWNSGEFVRSQTITHIAQSVLGLTALLLTKQLALLIMF